MTGPVGQNDPYPDWSESGSAVLVYAHKFVVGDFLWH